jgi:hypothetical protein
VRLHLITVSLKSHAASNSLDADGLFSPELEVKEEKRGALFCGPSVDRSAIALLNFLESPLLFIFVAAN